MGKYLRDILIVAIVGIVIIMLVGVFYYSTFNTSLWDREFKGFASFFWAAYLVLVTYVIAVVEYSKNNKEE